MQFCDHDTIKCTINLVINSIALILQLILIALQHKSNNIHQQRKIQGQYLLPLNLIAIITITSLSALCIIHEYSISMLITLLISMLQNILLMKLMITEIQTTSPCSNYYRLTLLVSTVCYFVSYWVSDNQLNSGILISIYGILLVASLIAQYRNYFNYDVIVPWIDIRMNNYSQIQEAYTEQLYETLIEHPSDHTSEIEQTRGMPLQPSQYGSVNENHNFMAKGYLSSHLESSEHSQQATVLFVPRNLRIKQMQILERKNKKIIYYEIEYEAQDGGQLNTRRSLSEVKQLFSNLNHPYEMQDVASEYEIQTKLRELVLNVEYHGELHRFFQPSGQLAQYQ